MAFLCCSVWQSVPNVVICEKNGNEFGMRQLRDTRRFVENRVRNLQSMFNGEPRLVRAEIAKHVKKIILTPEGRVYIASGTWDLLGSVAVRMVPGEGIGPNVCLFTSSGWRRPDPCCYESHKEPKQLPRSRTPESCRFPTTAASAYSVASTVSLSPIALVTATSVDRRGLP